MTAPETLTGRIELLIDRWNALPGHLQRGRLRGRVMELSLQLAEVEKLHRVLDERIKEFAKRVEEEEAAALDQEQEHRSVD